MGSTLGDGDGDAFRSLGEKILNDLDKTSKSNCQTVHHLPAISRLI